MSKGIKEKVAVVNIGRARKQIERIISHILPQKVILLRQKQGVFSPEDKKFFLVNWLPFIVNIKNKGITIEERKEISISSENLIEIYKKFRDKGIPIDIIDPFDPYKVYMNVAYHAYDLYRNEIEKTIKSKENRVIGTDFQKILKKYQEEGKVVEVTDSGKLEEAYEAIIHTDIEEKMPIKLEELLEFYKTYKEVGIPLNTRDLLEPYKAYEVFEQIVLRNVGKEIWFIDDGFPRPSLKAINWIILLYDKYKGTEIRDVFLVKRRYLKPVNGAYQYEEYGGIDEKIIAEKLLDFSIVRWDEDLEIILRTATKNFKYEFKIGDLWRELNKEEEGKKLINKWLEKHGSERAAKIAMARKLSNLEGFLVERKQNKYQWTKTGKMLFKTVRAEEE